MTSAQLCGTCHNTRFEPWHKGKHANAYHISVKKKKTKILKCVSCYVTGFGRRDGYINENLTAGLCSVNCTECHLTFKEHLTNNTKAGVRPLNEETCARCHNHEHDPGFNYNKALQQIHH